MFTNIGGLYFFAVFLSSLFLWFTIWVRSRSKGAKEAEVIQYTCAPSLLTEAESRFYLELREAVGNTGVIQCKVRLADVLQSRVGDIASFRRVSQKHIDFLVCERMSLRPILAIELDDRSHGRRDRRERDIFVDAAYKSAGLEMLHVKAQEIYDREGLREEIGRALSY